MKPGGAVEGRKLHRQSNGGPVRPLERAAEAEGYASVGAWASRALDAYLKQRLAAGAPVPLARHHGTVRVLLEDGEVHQIREWIAPPFGLFHGSASGPIPHGSTQRYALVYTPTGRILGTFRTAAHLQSPGLRSGARLGALGRGRG